MKNVLLQLVRPAPAFLFLSLMGLCCLPELAAQAPPKESREFLPSPFDRYFERRVAELSREIPFCQSAHDNSATRRSK